MHSARRTAAPVVTPPFGKLLRAYPLKHPRWARWGRGGSGAFFFVAGLALFALGAYQTYLHYYHNGPAVVAKDLVIPAAATIVLWGVALALLLGARHGRKQPAEVYECGLVVVDKRGKHAWRWEDFCGVWVGIYAPLAKGLNLQTVHRVGLAHVNGDRIVIDDAFAGIDRLADEICQQVNPRLYARHCEALEAGKELAYGQVRVRRAEGLRPAKVWLAWADIRAVRVEAGTLALSTATKGGKRERTLKVPVHRVENLDVLLAVIERYRVGVIPDNTSSAAGE